MQFQKHTSEKLINLFKNKPYQGQSPEKAKVILLSSDANYSPQITEHEFFKYILEYQKDGVEFWKKYNCHHPFLLPEYPFDGRKGGRRFHVNFRRLGLNSSDANKICFLELLDIPTIGNKSDDKKLFFSMMSEKHLTYINKLMTETKGKLFLISNYDDMQETNKNYNIFNWLENINLSRNNHTEVNGNRIKKIYHLSSTQINNQIDEIRSEIRNWID